MNADELKQHIRETFAGIRVDESGGDTFVTYDPDGDLPADRWHPFATIVTGDTHDTVSDLDHPGAYRLNIGLTKATYTGLFGAPPTERDDRGVLVTEHDHAVRDRLMPHPHYANQHWVCVVNPTGATFATLRPLLAEAYDFAVRKHTNHRGRVSGPAS
jgi:hypothetical protein